MDHGQVERTFTTNINQMNPNSGIVRQSASVKDYLLMN